MKEASKTKAVRPAAFYESFMSGRVLDIGCGDDICVPHAVPFDQTEGDANQILKYLQPETFDCVHSSHCLEHMFDPKHCVEDWWSLVRPGGVLITVVPDEDLYEQGNWPSIFNPDHKSTFRLDGSSSWSPVSYNVQDLFRNLPRLAELSARREDLGYIYRKPIASGSLRGIARKVAQRTRKFAQPESINTIAGRAAVHLALAAGYPVDQTLGQALAQIEVIARKER